MTKLDQKVIVPFESLGADNQKPVLISIIYERFLESGVIRDRDWIDQSGVIEVRKENHSEDDQYYRNDLKKTYHGLKI
jgi:hypothetical protein